MNPVSADGQRLTVDVVLTVWGVKFHVVGTVEVHATRRDI